MSQTLLNQWIEALNSGAYPQCKGQLVSKTWETPPNLGYCCLGVAAVVCATVPAETLFDPVWPYRTLGCNYNIPTDSPRKNVGDDLSRLQVALGLNGPDGASYRCLTPEESKLLPERTVRAYTQTEHRDWSSPFQPSLAWLNDNGTPFSTIAKLLSIPGLYTSPALNEVP